MHFLKTQIGKYRQLQRHMVRKIYSLYFLQIFQLYFICKGNDVAYVKEAFHYKENFHH